MHIKPRRLRYSGGLIIVDILLALSLSALFMAIISGSSVYAQKMYESAHERNALLND